MTMNTCYVICKLFQTLIQEIHAELGMDNMNASSYFYSTVQVWLYSHFLGANPKIGFNGVIFSFLIWPDAYKH